MIDLPSPALIGVIHLPALPGSARNLLSMDEIVQRALTDAHALRQAGFDAALIENFGDMPFTAGRLPPASVAALAVATDHVRRHVGLRVGINALRNDALSALGVAAAVGAVFIRVNVHTGVAATDQGLIEGQAHDTLAYRKHLGRPIAILADVHVKHATPINQPDLGLAAREAAYRGLADGLIVTGHSTGEPVVLDDVRRVRSAVPDRRVFIGSGAMAETVAALLSVASGVIVGTGIKVGNDPEQAVDPQRALTFARAARRT